MRPLGVGASLFHHLELSAVSLLSFDQLYERADKVQQPVPIAVVGGADATVLQAVRTAAERGWVRPWIFGKARDVRQAADECGVRLAGLEVVDAEDAAAAAVALVRSGQARLLMKGQIATPSLMKAVLDPASGLRTGRVICQVVLIELAGSARRFLMADTGICIQPTLAQKIDILRSAVTLAHCLGAECPRVAALAATETRVDSMPETLDAAKLQRLNGAGEIAGCLVRGPLSFDMAFDADASAKKQPGQADFGVADIMLLPNLLAANLTVKAIMYTAACRFGGVLCGTLCPVVFMSRADTTATRLNSIALAVHALACG
jgi:phosphotransacetylase